MALSNFVARFVRRKISNYIRTCSTDTHKELLERSYIPRRAILYIPGNDERKLEKIKNLNCDCFILDCEDGVAFSKKDLARQTIHKYLDTKYEIFNNTDCAVRFNGIESGLCEGDMETILSARNLPTTIYLPKVEDCQQIEWISHKLQLALGDKAISTKLRLILFIESALSLLNLSKICQRAIVCSKNSPFLLDGLVFGSDDYCADVGIIRTTDSKELQFARQYFVTVAKAYKLQAIDMVFIDYKDLDGLERQSREGAEFGFTGKQVIHPGQIETVQRAFTPSKEKIIWAKGLIEAFEQHHLEGKGAFVYKGSMIDRPLLLQAKNLVKFAETLGF